MTLTVFQAHSLPPLPSLPILDILEKFSVLYHLKFTKEKVIDILSLNNIYRKKDLECTSMYQSSQASLS